MKSLLLLTLLLVSRPVFACESYEECIQIGEKVYAEIGPEHQWASMHYTKAIAYKLDEISEHLKNQDPHYGWKCIRRLSDGFCAEEKRLPMNEIQNENKNRFQLTDSGITMYNDNGSSVFYERKEDGVDGTTSHLPEDKKFQSK